jgi:hypothetical protein
MLFNQKTTKNMYMFKAFEYYLLSLGEWSKKLSEGSNAFILKGQNIQKNFLILEIFLEVLKSLIFFNTSRTTHPITQRPPEQRP